MCGCELTDVPSVVDAVAALVRVSTMHPDDRAASPRTRDASSIINDVRREFSVASKSLACAVLFRQR